MKLIIFYFLIFSATSFSMFSPNISGEKAMLTRSNYENTSSGVVVKFGFGTEKKSCKGSGFCNMMIGHDFGLLIGASGGGIATNFEGRLQLNAMKSTMRIGIMNEYFSNDSFIMQGQFDLPVDIVEALNLEHDYIEIGVYEIEDMGKSIRIRF